jgi:hypothetical protein
MFWTLLRIFEIFVALNFVLYAPWPRWIRKDWTWKGMDLFRDARGIYSPPRIG